ncbi:MAG TPA: hypothetical protein DHV00_00145, partial [Alteromonas macleodii]|nr:hypothetical protein [Alteromonas macleodii]
MLNQNNKKVSVIMPAYNSSSFIEESISSILDQTFENLELIIIDDGSTDETLSIAKKWAETDNRIVVLSQKNKGVSAARNTAISKATGEILAFCDSDDVWYPNKL